MHDQSLYHAFVPLDDVVFKCSGQFVNILAKEDLRAHDGKHPYQSASLLVSH